MNLNEILSKARRGRLSKEDIAFLSDHAVVIEDDKVLKILKKARKGRLPVADAEALSTAYVGSARGSTIAKHFTSPSPVSFPVPQPTANPIEHPKHYTSHPSGVECIRVVEHMGFNLGNVVKYIWRADEKGAPIEDLKKARWYLDREIARRQ